MTEAREAEPQSTQPNTRINPVVFVGSSVCIIAIALWAILSPEGANGTIGVAVGWISEWFGWFYILIATIFLAFVIFLALSRYGNTKLGPEPRIEIRTSQWPRAIKQASGASLPVPFCVPRSQRLNTAAGSPVARMKQSVPDLESIEELAVNDAVLRGLWMILTPL
jgi:hypothetical protein